MKLYYKIKFGFKNIDSVVIDTKDDLEKAVYAMFTKQPVQIKGAYINGSNIVSIQPHWNSYTGWYDSYDPQTGEDFRQIERDAPKKELEENLVTAKTTVQSLLDRNMTHLIGNSAERKLLT